MNHNAIIEELHVEYMAKISSDSLLLQQNNITAEPAVKFAFVNVQCIRTKFNLITHLIDEFNIDVLCISEHWLTLHESEFYSNLGQLSLTSAFYRSIYKNGGTAVFVHSKLNSQPLDLNHFNNEKHFEIAGVYITSHSVLVLSIYRSPSGDIDTFFNVLDKCLSHLGKLGIPIVLGGDCNINVNIESNSEDTNYRHFIYILKSYGLFLTSRTPTRGSSCLDIIATTLRPWDYSVTTLDPVIADHCPVMLSLCLPSVVSRSSSFQWSHKYVRTKRLVKEESLPIFKSSLSQVNWVDEISSGDSEESFNKFFDIFGHVFDTVFPTKTLPICKRGSKLPSKHKNTDKSWYTPELADLRRLMIALHDRFKTCVDLATGNRLHSFYLRAKRRYRLQVDLTKKESNMNVINLAKNPCKAAWGLVNQVQKKKPEMRCLASPDEFNCFLLNEVDNIVGSVDCLVNSTNSMDLSNLPGTAFNSLQHWRSVSSRDITKIIKSFKNSRSPDIYGVTVTVLKYVAEEIAIPLAGIINTCLRNGKIPDSLKISRTVPVFKKGDPESIGSYRPISIIPVMGKVFEAVMKKQLVDYLEHNNLLADSQHGFRRGRSTISAVSELISDVLDTFEDKGSTALILADLSKAFDTVNHDILLSRLRSLGVGGCVLRTFASYLHNRRQVVSVAGANSEPKLVKHGVPQGSIMGPVLFIITINDLSRLGSILMFADDTTIVSKGVTPGQAMERASEVFEAAKVWFRSNGLSLNQAKTQEMVCTLGRTNVSNVKEVKLLGFVIDHNITWNGHVNSICTKLSRVIYLLRRLKPMLTEHYLVTVYHGLFHSHVTYGLLIWGHTARCDDILLLQKRAVRVIVSAGHVEHCKPIFKRLRLLTVYSQYVLLCLCYVKRNINLLPVREESHSHNLRNRNQLDIPFCRLSKKKNSYEVLALKMYNALPAGFKTLDLAVFEKSLKAWLVDRPFYSLVEYFEAVD